MLSGLIRGRLGVVYSSQDNMMKALVIAIRFAFFRKQFGPPGEPEIPIINYQLHQTRLIPNFAICLALRATFKRIIDYLKIGLPLYKEDP